MVNHLDLGTSVFSFIFKMFTWFRLGLENLEYGKAFLQSGNIGQTEKVRENHTTYWKSLIISDKI